MALQTLLRIPVSEETFAELSRQAEALKKPVEFLIAERLPQIVNTNSVKPIVIDDEQRRKLERALGRNFNESHELVKAVERAVTLQVGDYPVPLTPHLLERLKSRCFSMEFGKFVEFTVRRALEEYAGLR